MKTSKKREETERRREKKGDGLNFSWFNLVGQQTTNKKISVLVFLARY